jgi:tRNA(Ile2) C34 agmatinyltransferase TiaS
MTARDPHVSETGWRRRRRAALGRGEKLGRGAPGCTEEYKGLQRTLADGLKQKKRKEWGRRRKIDLNFFEKGFKQMNSNINWNSSNQK